MPNLLSINNYYYRRGGAEVVFLEQNKIFEEMGWTVVPFCMKHEKNESTVPNNWEEYFASTIEYSANNSLQQNLKNALKIIYSVEAQDKLQSLINIAHPSIAHLHNIYHHLSPSILPVLKKNGIPTVMTLHDLKLICPSYLMLSPSGVCEKCKNGHIYNVVINKCMKESLSLSALIFMETLVHRVIRIYQKNVDAFVVPSKFFIKKFTQWGWNPDRLTYIPNFVDTDILRPDFQPGNYFVFLGRLSREKGIKTLIQAAHQANIKLKIIGKGPLEEELKSITSTLNAEIEFMGYQSGESLHQIIWNARAVVLPSECYENAPICIMESYALGKPVIGANIGGIPELIKENQTGITFEPGNTENLKDALTKFKNMKNEAVSEMGKTARQWVENEFTVNNYFQRLQNLYTSLDISL